MGDQTAPTRHPATHTRNPRPSPRPYGWPNRAYPASGHPYRLSTAEQGTRTRNRHL